MFNDTEIFQMIESLNSRAEQLESSLIDMNIRSNGKLSLTEVYQMSFKQRESYIKLHNKYEDDKQGNKIVEFDQYY